MSPGGQAIYAIIRTGGKQYRVEPQQVIEVEKLPADVGATIEVTDVLMLSDGASVIAGQPLIEGARVVAEVLDHGRDPKIVVFKYKNKTRYRRRRGHRQPFTRLAIRNILKAGETAPAASAEEATPARPRRTRARPAADEATAAPEAAVEAAATETAAPATPRRRTTRKTEADA